MINLNVTDPIPTLQSASFYQAMKTSYEYAVPAFFDLLNPNIYFARHADGRLAPIHILDGLPDNILSRPENQIITGFVNKGRFMTRNRFLDLSTNRNVALIY